MKRVLFYLCFVFFFAATAVKGKCKKYNQRCRSNEQCCAISNGKSYCNFKTNRCEAWRYCDESDDFKCPFDDLSKDELEKGISLIRNSGLFSPDIQWPIVRKQEPDKKLWNSGHWTGRKRMMFAAVFDLRNHTLYEVKICLTTGKIESVEEKEEMIPPIMKSDYEIANEVALGDPRIAKAFERRGLNLSHAHFDMWAVGEHVPGSNKGQRRVKLVANYKPPGTL
ncbi:hypothetical protein Bhyg_14040 [Pseudolycoriella hygida]|uniref:Uncharacterized protein n=2 Tax=Pseudolycoriella hygida TaxID=35572 RepID=A0A9Q0MPT4_9DIPT|nr:hypothetical protein Bhyg_14040 [Pseudolycoriella hygida]